jgi:outer membrane lipoprotein LolB
LRPAPAPGKAAFLYALFLPVLLAGCATPSREQPGERERHAAYEQRAAVLGSWSRWGLSGRLGIELEDDGGSGRFEWAVDEQASELSFRGTLGQGSWRLRTDSRGALLSRGDGTESRARTVEELLRLELGWSVPVASLSWWVRGLVPPGSEPGAQVQLGVEGLPRAISDNNWHVSFDRWAEFEGLQLPRRVEATNGEVRVRLAVSAWRFPAPAHNATDQVAATAATRAAGTRGERSFFGGEE